MITDDIELLNPGAEPIGRNGFSATFSVGTWELWIHCTSELEEVVAVGDVASSPSKDALTVTPRAGGETAQFAGDRRTIYRRQARLVARLQSRSAVAAAQVESSGVGRTSTT